MAKGPGIVRKHELRRVIDILKEKGVPLGSLELLPGGEVRLNLALLAPQPISSDLAAEVSAWDEALK
ncbi:hypothetical protein [Rhizobium rhizoryzae]|uniref:hypothetical protein n=1 Tax=Rhizobium rhizoryzae TaxID=451876 RepID=UPI000E9BCA78|nr:hypothetical protein [Rhizobium rhizoryzae]HBY43978.1 hypothetical protein [Brevundimonas sp.]